MMLLSILAAASAASGWSYYGGDQGGMKYAPAPDITRENVNDLIPAWTYRTGHLNVPEKAARRSKFETTPILVDDKLVLCTPFNTVIALDPETGKELWRHDPKIDPELRPANHFNCRGVAYWKNPDAAPNAKCAARIFMGTNDGRVIAVDVKGGAPCAGFGGDGEIKIDPQADLAWPGEFQITSAPAAAQGVVVVGSAIADNVSVRAPHGTVRAFDARTGVPLWEFDPIPRAPEDAARLGWDAGVPVEGHANVWAPMSIDEARGLLFLPTSSPSPDFFGGLRPGDNRYANSVVALDLKTGAVRWSFQTVHHDVWDYDVSAQPLLATIATDGDKRDVVIQPTKTGLVFTLDRDTGEPVFPIEERPVPQGGASGESLSPTQPFPSAPRPLSRSAIKPSDAWGLTPWDKKACATIIASARFQGMFTPPTTGGTILHPSTGGGVNWGGGAFDPNTNRYYVNTSNLLQIVKLVPRAKTDQDWHDIRNGEQAPMRGAPYAMQRSAVLSPLGIPCNPPPWGELHAIDMSSGAVLWDSTVGTTEELAPFGVGLKTGTPILSGPLVTKGGLIFVGGAMDSYLRAFDAATGKELWQGKLPAGGQATPMSYKYKGRQYVVIAAGGHSELKTRRGDYVIAYALPRVGEPGPSFASRTLNRPGRRFLLTLIFSLAGAAALFALAMRRLRPRR